MQYDVVIIGSGLGGLLCGLTLSREGMNVCIIEQQQQIGGLLQTFRRDGRSFDTGVHYGGSLGEGEVLNQYFKYYGILDQLNIKKMNENAFDIISFNGKEYSFANGNKRFVDTLLKDFPKEREALQKYVNTIEQVSRSHNMYDLRIDEDYHNTETLKSNAWDFVQSLTNDKILQNVLCGSNFLYSGVSTKTPLLTHSLVQNSYLKSAWKFVDGSNQLIRALVSKIKANGGTILRGRKAIQLVSDSENIKSVITETGEEISAKHFISAIHPALLLDMIESKQISKPYRRRIMTAENTDSAFILYVSFKDKTFKYKESNYYFHSAPTVWADKYAEKRDNDFYFITFPLFSSTNGFAETASVISNMKFSEVSRWADTCSDDRGEDYENFKIQKAEYLINLIDKKFEGFKDSISNYWTSTPLTLRDYTGSPSGSMYGILKDSNNPFNSVISHKTKIPNLLLTGQNVNLHGLVGVSISAALTCSEFIGKNNIIRDIKNA